MKLVKLIHPNDPKLLKLKDAEVQIYYDDQLIDTVDLLDAIDEAVSYEDQGYDYERIRFRKSYADYEPYAGQWRIVIQLEDEMGLKMQVPVRMEQRQAFSGQNGKMVVEESAVQVEYRP